MSCTNYVWIRAIGNSDQIRAIIGIRAKEFSKKEFILASGRLILQLVEIIFSPFFGDPCQFFSV